MRRIANLDLVRAVAIALVVVYHIVQQTPGMPPLLVAVARGGQLGVDLFFVLSGYLIGGLWWDERANAREVSAPRFVLRRALRTLPPYFVVLPVAWLAVSVARGDRFDPAYLVMLQNYEAAMPFFLVSWSLCIEEHFYLLLPLLLTRLDREGRPLRALLVLAALPMALRAVTYWRLGGVVDVPFGAATTATHLRFDGLLLGVAGAWLIRHRAGWTRPLERWMPLLVAGAGLVVATFAWMPRGPFYVVGYTGLAALFTLLVGRLHERAPIRALRRPAAAVAAATYSIYLVHPLALHAALEAARRLHVSGPAMTAALMLALVAVVSAVFYQCVEKPSLALRRHLAPRLRREMATT